MLHTAADVAREIEAYIDALDPLGLTDYDVILRDVGGGMLSVTIQSEGDADHHFAIPTLH